ncbi:MAG: hypothetical protein RLZZ628_1188 [Bacteroidota bacterium]|jgi:carboxypeptidase PM20D1
MILIKKWSLFVALLTFGWVASNGQNRPILPLTLSNAEILRMQYALQAQTISGIKPWPTGGFDDLARLIDITRYDTTQLTSGPGKAKASRYVHLPKVLEKITFMNLLTDNIPFNNTNEIKYSLLYRWKKSSKINSNKKPFIFMAHQDVVPVAEADKASWTHEAFAGEIAPDILEPDQKSFFGRGAIDNKGNMMSILEAIERLAAEGFQPDRDLFFIFEHDEEGKATGAQTIVKYLENTYGKNSNFAEMLMDEGGSIVTNLVDGLKISAVIGTAEKGFVTIGIKAAKQGGHASMPDTSNSIMLVANALKRVYDKTPTYKFDRSTELFFEKMGPYIDNADTKLWFSDPYNYTSQITTLLAKDVKTHAMIHTSMAPTVFAAGDSNSTNVVPSFVTAYMNFRMVTGDSATGVLKNVRSLIPNVSPDSARENLVSVFIKDGRFTNPTGSKEPEGSGYQLVSQMVKKIFNNIPTSPFLMIGATDSRYFEGLADHFIKFSPVTDPQGFHTYNERIKVEDYRKSILFYQQLISEGKCLSCKAVTLPSPVSVPLIKPKKK